MTTLPLTPSPLPVFTNEKTETRIMSRKLRERVPSLGQERPPPRAASAAANSDQPWRLDGPVLCLRPRLSILQTRARFVIFSLSFYVFCSERAGRHFNG